MKKTIFLLLLFTASLQLEAQATLANKLKITGNTTSINAPFVNVQETDGLVNKISKSDLIDVVIVNTTAELTAEIGNVNKLYATRDNTIIYRYNGTIYVSLTPDISGKEDIANKQNSLAVDVTNLKYPTVTAVRTHATDTNNPHAVSKTQVGLGNVNDTSDANKPVSTATQTALNLKVNTSILGADNGAATLDSSGKVPLTQINDALLGSVNYKGTYNASTNNPVLPAVASGNKGHYYIISTAGVQVGLTLNIGDWVISNGEAWGKVDNNNAVTSVNGLVGSVVLNTVNVSDSTNKRYQTDLQRTNNDATSPIQAQLNGKQSTISGTANVIPKFGTGGLVGSQIFDNGTNVGIGTANPQTLLNIGTGSPTSTTSGIRFGDDVYAFIYRSSATTLTIGSNITVGNNLIVGNQLMANQFVNSSNQGISFTSGFASLQIGSGQPLIRGAFNEDTVISPGRNDTNNLGDVVVSVGGSTRATFKSNGNLLVNTTTDNGVDKLQVNGTISASPATLPNQVVVKSQLDLKADLASIRPYKSFVAVINQSGTGAPTITTLENTLGATITPTRISAGSYVLTYSTTVIGNGYATINGDRSASGQTPPTRYGISVGNTSITISSSIFNSGLSLFESVDGILSSVYLEVRIY